MRNQEIFLQLKEAGIPQKAFNYCDPSNLRINNLSLYRRRIDILASIPGFSNDCKTLLGSTIYTYGQDSIRVDAPTITAIQTTSDKLYAHACGLYQFIESTLSHEDDNSVYFKIPDTTDVNCAIKTIDEINKALSQFAVNDTLNGKIELKSWERGSFWLELGLGTASAMYAFGRLLQGLAIAYKDYQTGRNAAELTRGLHIDNDVKERLYKAIETGADNYIKTEAENLEKQLFNDSKTPETSERIKYALTTLFTFIKNGGAIQVSLNAKPEVQKAIAEIETAKKIQSHDTQLLSSNNEMRGKTE